MKLFERYLFFSTLKVVVFCLSTFFFLYVLIDYSIHARSFHHGLQSFPWRGLLSYYTTDLVSRLDILLPFACLLGATATYYKINQKRELIALLAGGIPLRSILKPILLIGVLGMLCIYVIEEKIPLKKEFISAQKNHRKNIHHLNLKDDTTLLFSGIDRDHKTFQDVWWIRSNDEIIQMDTLSIQSSPPLASGIHFFKKENGLLTLTDKKSSHVFKEMHFFKKQLIDHFIDAKEFPITTLWKKLPETPPGERRAQLMTALIQKTTLPWFCLFAMILPLPHAVKFSRNNSFFLLTASSLFFLAAMYLLINAGAVLNERQVLSSSIAMGFPIILSLTIGCIKYYRSK